jgi:hypothetical protein
MSVIIISIIYSLSLLLDTRVKYTLPAVKKIFEQKEEEAEHIQTPSIAEYTMIAEENLFHPERKIPVEKKEEKPLPKPEIVLYGTLITDDISLAYLEDLKAPYSTPGRGKRQTALRKGDTMSGFILKEIEDEKIVMVRGEEKMTVYLNEPLHPKDRKESGVTTTEPAPPPVTQQPVAQHKVTKQPQQPPKQETTTPFSQLQATPETTTPQEQQRPELTKNEVKKKFTDIFFKGPIKR